MIFARLVVENAETVPSPHTRQVAGLFRLVHRQVVEVSVWYVDVIAHFKTALALLHPRPTLEDRMIRSDSDVGPQNRAVLDRSIATVFNAPARRQGNGEISERQTAVQTLVQA